MLWKFKKVEKDFLRECREFHHNSAPVLKNIDILRQVHNNLVLARQSDLRALIHQQQQASVRYKSA